MDYVAWKAKAPAGFCALECLENVEDSYELKRGISRANGFPADASFRMDAAHPKNVKLADNVYNLDRMLVVSKKLKELIESKAPPSTEFLPVTIYNHKGRVASADYFIVNPFLLQDCIDKKKSQIEWNDIDPELICSCFGLVLLPDTIDPKLLLFRPKHMPTIVLVRRDLADEIEAGGFTGIKLVGLDEFEL
jgi:hypothetical protein